MEKKTLCVLTYEHFGRESKEDIYLDSENFEDDAKNVLKLFNDEEYRRKNIKSDYYMDIRTLISVIKLKETRNFCNLEKLNVMTNKDKYGYYDFLECKGCLRVHKRYSLDTPVGLICNPKLICSKCRKEFKIESRLIKHIALNKCKQHPLK